MGLAHLGEQASIYEKNKYISRLKKEIDELKYRNRVFKKALEYICCNHACKEDTTYCETAYQAIVKSEEITR